MAKLFREVFTGSAATIQRRTLWLLVGAALVQVFWASPAAAQSMRTYVSGLGSDSNGCTAVSPCRTLQGTLSKTSGGGEIFVLDSADYGPVTINKAVTIASEGALAGILATSGTAITIQAGPADVVNLRGLDLDGGNAASLGIQFNSGAVLNIQKSTVRGFTYSGLNFTPTASSALYVSDTVMRNNLIGIYLHDRTYAMLNRVSATANSVGIVAVNSNVTMTDAVVNYSSYGLGAVGSAVTVRNSTFSSNGVGVAAFQAAVVQVSQSSITGNGTGWMPSNGQVLSFGNNNVAGNGTDGTPSRTLALQ